MCLNQQRIKHELCNRQVGDDVTESVLSLFFFSGGTKNYNMSSVCCEVSHPVTDVTGFVLHLTTLLSVLDSIHTLSGPVAPASLHKDRVGVLCR